MRPTRAALAALLFAFAGCIQAAPVSVIDDTGREVALDAPARRIVSLAPHLTEILFAMGVGEHIVGTVRYSDYPEAAKAIPRLGDAFSVSVESVIAMEPDLVFAWQTGGTMRAVERLVELGVPVYINEAPTLADIPRSTRAMAALVGKAEHGRALANSFDERLARASRDGAAARVFFQISDERLYTVNDEHLIGQAIRLCGGINTFAGTDIPVPLVGQEAVVGADPDLIVVTQAPGTSPSPWVEKWGRFPSLEGKVRTIDPNLISRPGLRMAEGIDRLCNLIEEAAAKPGE